MLEALSLGAGLSWASGMRLYLSALLVGLFARLGVVALPAGLHFLVSPWLLALFGLLTLGEFLADKIPALDSLWDAVHTVIRIPAGAVLAVCAIGPAEPRTMVLTALGGAALSGAAHLTKSGVRAMINFFPGAARNWAASLVEDLLVFIGLSLALFSPLLFDAFLAAFLVCAMWALPRLWRSVRGGWTGMATRMVPEMRPVRIKRH
jgi:hypothetical protein